jgi:hypothetical protein
VRSGGGCGRAILSTYSGAREAAVTIAGLAGRVADRNRAGLREKGCVLFMRPVELRELLLITVQVRPIVDLGGGRRFVPFDGGTFEGRGFGPELPMKLVEERAPGGFADVADVITAEEIAEVTENYRATAGFSLAALQRGTSFIDDPYPL